MDVRCLRIACAASHDVAELCRTMGQEYFFADRLARQEQGRGVLLVAWLDGDPIGDVYVWQDAAEEPEVRGRLPGVPLLNHLEVHRAWRNQGIGTRLIGAAEDLLRDGGHGRVALGVGLDNHDAVRLYEKLGYEEWPYPPVDTVSEVFGPGGRPRRFAEVCRIFVKSLS